MSLLEFFISNHSITLSARNSSVGGIDSPSAFAVLILIIKSSLVGCSTARLPGLAPFRIPDMRRGATNARADVGSIAE